MRLLLITALMWPLLAFSQTQYELAALDENLERFLNANLQAYEHYGRPLSLQKMAADQIKIRQAVLGYLKLHPNTRIATCRFRNLGEYRFEYRGRRTQFLDEQNRQIQARIKQSLDPETVAIFAGSVEPVYHPPRGKAVNSLEEIDSYEKFKLYALNEIDSIRSNLNEVVSIRVAVLRFKRWGVSKAQLVKFMIEELKIPNEFIEDNQKTYWMNRASVDSEGQFFKMKSKPADDPVVDFKIFFSALAYQCSKHTPYQGADIVYFGMVGVSTDTKEPKYGGGSREIWTTFEEAKAVFAHYFKLPSLSELYHSIRILTESSEFLEVRQQIEDYSGCGVTLDFEVRKPSVELRRDQSLYHHLGFRGTFVIQGWDDQSFRRILSAYHVDPFRFLDLFNGQSAMSKPEVYLSHLRKIRDKVKELPPLCTKPTRSHVDL